MDDNITGSLKALREAPLQAILAIACHATGLFPSNSCTEEAIQDLKQHALQEDLQQEKEKRAQKRMKKEDAKMKEEERSPETPPMPDDFASDDDESEGGETRRRASSQKGDESSDNDLFKNRFARPVVRQVTENPPGDRWADLPNALRKQILKLFDDNVLNSIPTDLSSFLALSKFPVYSFHSLRYMII